MRVLLFFLLLLLELPAPLGDAVSSFAVVRKALPPAGSASLTPEAPSREAAKVFSRGRQPPALYAKHSSSFSSFFVVAVFSRVAASDNSHVAPARGSPQKNSSSISSCCCCFRVPHLGPRLFGGKVCEGLQSQRFA